LSHRPSERQSTIIEPVLVRNFRADDAQKLRLVRPPDRDEDVLGRIGPGHGGCTVSPVADPDPEHVA
jgi:hypothetical protein